MSLSFENRETNILENPGVRYQDTKFETYPKVLRQAVKNGEISHQAMTLWLTLSELAGHDREAYSGQEYLANELNTSIPTVKRWTKELEITGWLFKINRTATSNKYYLAIPKEHDVLHPSYTPRASTVAEELGKNKRRTHKVMDDSIDTSNLSHKLIDEPIDKLTGDPMDKLIDEPLKRQSIKETEFKDTKLLHVPQTLELPEELDGTSCLADKIPSSVSGDLKDAPSALGILESLDFFGKEDSVTDSNFSGESNNGTSCLDSYTETDSEREEKMPLLGNLDTNEISIGKTLIESSTHTSNSSIRTWKEEADLARQKQNQKILETIAQQKALKEAQEARQEAFRTSLAELHPELTEGSQNAVQSLQDIPSVSRLDKYAGLRAS